MHVCERREREGMGLRERVRESEGEGKRVREIGVERGRAGQGLF